MVDELFVYNQKNPFAFFIVGALLLYQFISVLIYFPYFFPYTNKFLINKKNVYKVWGDDNIYQSKGVKLVNEYLLKHPEIQYEPIQFVHGKVMVSLENYLDFWCEGKIQWLLNLNLKPVDHFDSQYLMS